MKKRIRKDWPFLLIALTTVAVGINFVVNPNLLDDPYWLGKTSLGENIADPTKQFPITSSNAEIYRRNMTEPFVVGETYTVTLKGTKPADKNFRLLTKVLLVMVICHLWKESQMCGH